MRNVEKLRDYYLGKDPMLKETMADNALRLVGIEGKYYVLRSELLERLGRLKQDLLDGAIKDLQDHLNELEDEVVTFDYLTETLEAYYTKTDVDEIISHLNTLKFEVVEELPSVGIRTDTIYLVPKPPETSNIYDEYIWVNDNWELIGSTAVDLTNYYTKAEVDAAINSAIAADLVPITYAEINVLFDF